METQGSFNVGMRVNSMGEADSQNYQWLLLEFSKYQIFHSYKLWTWK